MIPLTCPNCGLTGDVPAFLLAPDYERAIQAAMRLPPSLATLVWSYLYLFKPTKNRMKADRLARILETLAEQIDKAEVTRAGITWTAPLATWNTALRIVQDSPPAALPMKNHNYLYQIVANLAARAAVQSERQAEAAARAPERRFYTAGQPEPPAEPDRVEPERLSAEPVVTTRRQTPAGLIQLKETLRGQGLRIHDSEVSDETI